MTRSATVSFRLLGSHGVPELQIIALEDRYGRRIPAQVIGPDDVIAWLLRVLPWDDAAMVLRDEVRAAAKKGGVADEADVQDVLRLLTGEPRTGAAAVRDRLHAVVERQARERGWDLEGEGLEDQPDLSVQFRSVVAAYYAAAACAHAATGPFETASAAAAHRSLLWCRSLEHHDVRPYAVDEQIRVLAAQLAVFITRCLRVTRA